MSQHVIISIIISLIILVDKTVLILNSELTTSVIKTPISDQDRVSLYDIHRISSRQMIRIRRSINQGIIS